MLYICSVKPIKKNIMWNKLIKVIKNGNIDQNDKKKAEMLLSYLNTASGTHLMRKEIQYFLEEMKNKYDIQI